MNLIENPHPYLANLCRICGQKLGKNRQVNDYLGRLIHELTCHMARCLSLCKLQKDFAMFATLFLKNKNKLNKNTEAEIAQKNKNKLRTD